METLTFVRKTNKQKDFPHPGFIYLNTWQTGYQYLVFDTKDDAERAKANIEKKNKTLIA